MSRNWDFSGWATKAGIKCSDGRTILPNAFSGCDGKTVPLVWNHQHNDPSEVLGHALLEDRGDGVYAYCSFNNNAKGREAKELVKHGDIKALSIYANNLVQSSKIPPCDVVHGVIREVSLVLAGANIGAFIDNVMAHGDVDDTEAEIYHGDYDEDFILYHADNDEDEEDEEDKEMSSGRSAKEILEDLTPEQKSAVGLLLDQVMSHADKDDEDEDDDRYEEDETEEPDEDEDYEDDNADEEEEDEVRHSDEGDLIVVADAIIHAALTGEDADDYVSELVHNMSDEQQLIIGDILNETAQHALEDDEYLAHSFDEYEDSEDMKYNVFENYDNYAPVVTHADEVEVLELAKKVGSLKHAVEMSLEEGGVLAHAITDHDGNSVTYGVANVDYLFPDAKSLNNPPEFINKPEAWVDKVINGTHHTPFSRVKSLFADLSGEDARARGYVKGKKKVEEVIEALKRETHPQTIYKKQKLDRDDIIDITDFDVVAWLKAEMQIMLKAEIARAILIGDGRASGDDKIKETSVRPIYNDEDTYTVKVPVDVASGATDKVKAEAIIDAIILSRKDYKGSGNPSFFVQESFLGQMLILKDSMGRRLYNTEAELASALRVKELIPVDVMEGQKIAITEGQTTSNKDLVGIIVNLQDYNVGADKGGQTSFFDDFDIDYNQFKYLYETRMSGALIKPYSAMSIYINEA